MLCNLMLCNIAPGTDVHSLILAEPSRGPGICSRILREILDSPSSVCLRHHSHVTYTEGFPRNAAELSLGHTSRPGVEVHLYPDEGRHMSAVLHARAGMPLPLSTGRYGPSRPVSLSISIANTRSPICNTRSSDRTGRLVSSCAVKCGKGDECG